MSNEPNQPQSDPSGSSLSGPNLKQAARCPRQESSGHRARPANGDGGRVHTNSRPASGHVTDGPQAPAMSNSGSVSGLRLVPSAEDQPRNFEFVADLNPAAIALERGIASERTIPRSTRDDPLLTVQEVAARLNVTKDWVWDHSSRKAPHLPVIRMGDGTLRYRASRIEEFIDERERLTNLRRRHG